MGMTALERVVIWTRKNLLPWQQDAVRRYLQRGRLEDRDERELLDMLLARQGLCASGVTPPEPRPPEIASLSGGQPTAPRIALKTIGKLKGVNAIDPEAVLDLNPDGLNVIYGGNGSGKSGYVRVLKDACGARGGEPILPNVFLAGKSPATTAQITYAREGHADRTVSWKEGAAPDSNLTAIAIFDSKSARIVVDEEHEIAYSPYGMDVFDAIVGLYARLRAALQAGTRTIHCPTPTARDLPPETPAHAFFVRFVKFPAKTQISSEAQASPERDRRIQQLAVRLDEIGRGQLEQAIADRRALTADIEKTIKCISDIEAAAGSDAMISLKGLLTKWNESAEAEESLRRSIETKPPLRGVGTSAWQDLFHAAARYSQSDAYPEREFPVLEEGAKCVFCMQELSAPAKALLRDFANFISDRAHKAKTAAQTEVLAFSRRCGSLLGSLEIPSETTLAALARYDPGLPDLLRVYVAQRVDWLSRIMAACATHLLPEPCPLVADPRPGLLAVLQALGDELDERIRSRDPAVQAQVKAELAEAAGWAWLASHRMDLDRAASDAQYNLRLAECEAELNTAPLTAASKGLRLEAVQEGLQSALSEEMAALSIEPQKLPLSHAFRGEKAVLKKQLVLKAPSVPPGASMSQILSEGEQRAIALAGFFAELRTAAGDNPIVLDDPVSSLDHERRELLAKRIVAEWRDSKRQIIVFTHDNVFVSALIAVADDARIPTAACHLWRGETVGKVGEGIPWTLKDLRKKIEDADARALGIQAARNSTPPDELRRQVQELAHLLRLTIERAIEKCVLNETVTRHGKVEVANLSGVKYVQKSHYQQIQRAYSSFTPWHHDEAAAVQRPLPTDQEVQQAIIEVAKVVREFAARRNLQSVFSRFEQPPPLASGTTP